MGVLGVGGALLASVLGVAGLAQAGGPDVSMAALPLSAMCGDSPAHAPREIDRRLVVKAWYPKQAENAVVANTRAPVLFFNASWGGSVENHMNQIGALVQRGYVVIGVDHSLGPDAYGEFVDFSGEAAFARTKAAVDLKADEFAKDNSAVLDILRAATSCETDGTVAPLLRRLDFNRVGIIGYSFGGAVAAETSRQDFRFKAAVNLDGWLFGQVGTQGLSRPFLEVSDDSPLPTPADLKSNDTVQRLTAVLTDGDVSRLRSNLARYGGYFLVMEGSRHQSFVDASKRSFLGRVASYLPSARRTDAAVNAYVGAFFDQYVADIGSDLSQRIASPDAGVRVVFAKTPLSEAT